MNKVSRNDLISVIIKSKRTLRIERAAYSVGDNVPLVLDKYIVLQGDTKLVDLCAELSGNVPVLHEGEKERLITMVHDVPLTGIVPDHVYLSVWG